MSLRTAQRASTAVAMAALAVALLAPDLLRAAGPVLLVLAAVAGLPHGAADVTLLGRRPGRSAPDPRAVGAYAACAGVAVGAALLAPGPVLVALLLLSAAHFAEGEIAFSRQAGRPDLSSLPGLAVGTVVVALPMTRWPQEVAPLLQDLSPDLATAVTSPGGRTALAAGALLAVTAGLARGDRRQRWELGLVCALVLAAPPLAAFAVWFAGWHSVRHLARLGVDRPVGPLLRAAVVPSLGAVAVAVPLLPVVGGLGASVLLVLLALTVPHAAVVALALRHPRRRGQRGSTSPTPSPATAIAASK